MAKSKLKKYYFYKKNRSEFIAEEDKNINTRAKNRLKEIYENSKKYRIPKRLLDQWDDIALYNAKGDVEKAKALFLVSQKSAYDLSNPLNDLLAKEWLPETITVFSQKGLGAKSEDAQIERLHPAPFSFQDVARHIKFFTKEGDTVLDPFVGVGSTLKACSYENRQGVGIELNPKYAEFSKQRVEKEVPDDFPYKKSQTVINDDCISATKALESDSIDFIITSPPYWNILETTDHKAKARISENLDTKYSENSSDLGNIDDYDTFLDIISDYFGSCSRILKNKKYMAIIVSDFRKLDRYYIFHADLAREIERKSKFKLKGIKILYQRHKSIFPYGYPYSFVPNVHHQNVLIFQNHS